MKVRITGKAWFTPDNRLLKHGEHEVPDDWNMPKGVEEVEDEEPKAKPVKPVKPAAA
jgi:hypothetical protein